MPRTFVWHPKRGPARTPKGELTTGRVRIEQVRSGIGQTWRMRRTLEALGLKHHQDVVEHQDSPSLRGQIKAVRHLVKVTPIRDEGDEASGGRRVASGGKKGASTTRNAPPATRHATRKKNDGE